MRYSINKLSVTVEPIKKWNDKRGMGKYGSGRGALSLVIKL